MDYKVHQGLQKMAGLQSELVQHVLFYFDFLNWLYGSHSVHFCYVIQLLFYMLMSCKQNILF